MTATYFLGTSVLAIGPSPHWWDDTTPDSPSLVFVCPTCGDAWGRILNSSSPQDWLPIRRGCQHHPWCDEVGGSFIPPWRHGCPAELPQQVLSYELSLRTGG